MENYRCFVTNVNGGFMQTAQIGESLDLTVQTGIVMNVK